jgi:cystathionine beta-lyase
MGASRRAKYVLFDQLDESVLRFRPGVKWGAAEPGVLPASIADMDFPVAEPILDSLRHYLDLGDFGYPHWPNGASPLRAAFSYRMRHHYGWWPEPEHVVEFSDTTYAMRTALELATEPGDGVAIHTPVFGPLAELIERLGRRMVALPMTDTETGWTVDPVDHDRRVALRGCRALILVNPHNPTGRVFSEAELLALGGIAERHDLTVISDDLHADLTFPPHRHIPFASLDPALESRTVTLYGASKAFNLAGLRCSLGHFGVGSMRTRLAELPPPPGINVAGMRASLAAWTEGADWLDTVVGYLDVNRRLIAEVAAERLPGIRYHLPEATYLAWLDCRGLGLGAEPADHFRRVARVKVNPGSFYQPGGEGYVRLNFATPTPLLRAMLDRMADSVAAPLRQAQ